MSLFAQRSKCPYCNKVLPIKPERKAPCPFCGKFILVRMGDLVTEEDAHIEDWLMRTGISRTQFDKTREHLSQQFNQRASVGDTIWSLLNELVAKYATHPSSLEQVYRHMSALMSGEGKDPTMYLLEAEKVRAQYERKGVAPGKEVFLGHDELGYVRKLRQDEKFDKAEELLMRADPSPAVLDELRKLAVARAALAKKRGDWKSVVTNLEGYENYASKWRSYCIKLVNQEPPPLTERDKKLLKEAQAKL